MRPTAVAQAGGNRLLGAIKKKDRTAILGKCEPVSLVFGTTLAEPGATILHVYFPLDSYISLITPRHAAESLEVGLVGNEGMFGITLALGVDASPLKGLVQGEGDALRMKARDFRRALADSPSFARVMHAYLYVLVGQIAQTALCGRYHRLEARLARWILMTHDRAGQDSFRITHAFLAQMLGVRRSGVTVAAGLLQEKKYIHYRHGVMDILDRRSLEKLSCPCYGIVNALYAKHLA